MRPGLSTLEQVPLFASLPLPIREALNGISDLARVGPDEVLVQEGERVSELNVLIAGYVAATQSLPSNGESLTDVLAPVAALCLPAAALGRPAIVGIRTVTSARLVVVPAAELQALIRSEPSLSQLLLDHALSSLEEVTRETCHLKLRSSAQRLALYLLRLIPDPEMVPPRFALPYEKRLLAAKIGCSQENLSRAFAALRRFGVESQRGVVVLRDLHGLRTFAKLPPLAERRTQAG
jgi:CRP-like cAMP-binding protein